MNKNIFSPDYPLLLKEIKSHIQTAQVKAKLAVNRELILLYWNIGRLITKKENQEGWGTKIIERLSNDLQNSLSDIKGFSVRNIKRMKAFYMEYPIVPQLGAQLRKSEKTTKNNDLPESTIVPQAGAQLGEDILKIPWRHNILLIEKVKNSLPSIEQIEKELQKKLIKESQCYQ